jgi:Protein of unknown function (DUF2586)
MANNNVTFNVVTGGLGRVAPSIDNVCGLMMSGVATTATTTTVALPLLTSVRLKNVKDAERYGINAAYDTANNCLVYYHITEFFRISPSGILWLRLAAVGIGLTSMASKTNTQFAKQLLIDAEGEIQTLAIACSYAANYNPSLATGLDADVVSAIPLAQGLSDEEFLQKRPVQILLEGRSFNGTAGNALNLRTVNPSAKNVTIVIGQDLDAVLPTANSVLKAHAAIGTALGTVSKANVGHCIGWVQNYNLLGAKKWQRTGFSNNAAVGTMTDADQQTLADKGYLFARKLVGNSDVFWRDSPTCTAETDDYFCIENNRIINKAIRQCYIGLQPIINGSYQMNADGTIPPDLAGYFESLCTARLGRMQNNGEISAYDVYVNPAQNIVQLSTLNLELRIVPLGTTREIIVNIGLTAAITQ